MNWAAVIKAILDLLNNIFLNSDRRKHQTLGRLEEAQRNAEIENELYDRVRRASPDSVPDLEAFGGEPTGDLPGPVEK
jgi:hypothetical protein